MQSVLYILNDGFYVAEKHAPHDIDSIKDEYVLFDKRIKTVGFYEDYLDHEFEKLHEILNVSESYLNDNYVYKGVDIFFYKNLSFCKESINTTPNFGYIYLNKKDFSSFAKIGDLEDILNNAIYRMNCYLTKNIFSISHLSFNGHQIDYYDEILGKGLDLFRICFDIEKSNILYKEYFYDFSLIDDVKDDISLYNKISKEELIKTLNNLKISFSDMNELVELNFGNYSEMYSYDNLIEEIFEDIRRNGKSEISKDLSRLILKILINRTKALKEEANKAIVRRKSYGY